MSSDLFHNTRQWEPGQTSRRDLKSSECDDDDVVVDDDNDDDDDAIDDDNDDDDDGIDDNEDDDDDAIDDDDDDDDDDNDDDDDDYFMLTYLECSPSSPSTTSSTVCQAHTCKNTSASSLSNLPKTIFVRGIHLESLDHQPFASATNV